MKIIATTTQSVSTISEDFNKFLNESNILYVPRNRKSLNELRLENQADMIIVWKNEGPILYYDDQQFFFHPSMAKNRLSIFRKDSSPDLMARACAIAPGDDFLDCTLGLGADAIVASYFSGTGRITGLEVSLPIYYIVKWGMKLYQINMQWLDQAIKRIEVLNTDHLTYLKQQAEDSYDIVYFDPMFRKPVMQSQPIAPLRKIADHSPLTAETIEQACRVARKKVVMKELFSSGEIDRLDFKKIVGSHHNKIAYGVIDIK